MSEEIAAAREAIESARREVMALYGGNLDHPALDHLEAALCAVDYIEWDRGLAATKAENEHLRVLLSAAKAEIEHLEALLREANEAFDEVTDDYAQELVAGEEWRTYYDDNLRSTD